MAPDVETPDPPDVTNRGLPAGLDPADVTAGADLRRGDVETALRDGAWDAAFQEWADDSDLSDDQIRALDADGVFGAFDVFWNPVSEALDFEAPTVPATFEGQDSSVGRSLVRRELDDLGEMVVETLAAGSLSWDEDDGEFNWGDETFGESSDDEE